MASLFKLRRSEPAMMRSYRAPAYPLAPGLALVLATGCLVAVAWLNPEIFAVFAVIMIGGYGLYRLLGRRDLLATVQPGV
jgi:ethanolamine permease